MLCQILDNAVFLEKLHVRSSQTNDLGKELVPNARAKSRNVLDALLFACRGSNLLPSIMQGQMNLHAKRV